MTKKQKMILSAWYIAEEEAPDKSTEYLLAVVADICRVEVGEVTEVLALVAQESEV